MIGVVNEAPVPNDVPPLDAAYQVNVPALAVAPNVTVPASQREAGVVFVIVGFAFTVNVIGGASESQEFPSLSLTLFNNTTKSPENSVSIVSVYSFIVLVTVLVSPFMVYSKVYKLAPEETTENLTCGLSTVSPWHAFVVSSAAVLVNGQRASSPQIGPGTLTERQLLPNLGKKLLPDCPIIKVPLNTNLTNVY